MARYRRRFRSWGARRMSSSRRRFGRGTWGRGSRNRGILGIGLKYAAGAALGYMAPRVVPYQDLVITAMAVLPVRLPYGIKGIAQGYVAGMIIKNFLPSIGGISGASDNFTV